MSSKIFDLQPTLTGNLVNLRPLRAEEFEPLYALASDPLIWEQHPQSDRYQREVFAKFFEGALASRGALAVQDQSGSLIGCTRFYDFDLNLARVSIGYTFLCRQYWGGAYNREMKDLMLRHSFGTVSTVFFEVGEKNLRSRRAMEKIGGKLVEVKVLDGKSHVIYGIRKSDYLEKYFSNALRDSSLEF